MRKIKPEKVDALRTLVTGAFGSDANAEEVVYLENQSPVPKADIDAKYAEMLAEYDALQYQRDRLQEYPNLQECIHALLDGEDTLTELQTKRSEIKQKYPKPT